MLTLDMPPARKAEEIPPERSATLCGRVTPQTAEAFDAIARSMRPTPSRSQLVALAIEEFIEREQAKAASKK